MKRFLSILLAAMMLLSLASVSAEGATIVYWSMWESTEPQGQVIQKAVDAYMAKTGNKVDLQFKGRAGIREGLQPALDAGTVIDLFDEDIDRVNRQWGSYLLNLEELVKESKYEETAISGLMSAAREVGEGQLKSIPYQPNVFNYFYNKAVFDEVGIKEVPKTWEEFLTVCEMLNAKGVIPVTSDDAYILTMLGYHMARYLGAEGVSKVVKEGLWKEEPAVLKTAQAFEEMAKKNYFSPTIGSSTWPTNQNGEMALGLAAMYLNGSWLPNEVKNMTGPDFVWGCFSYPTVEGGKVGLEGANYGAQVLAINKNSKVSKEAFELIQMITKGEFDSMLSSESIGIPADTTNTEWPAMLANVKPVMESLSVRFPWAAGIEDNQDMSPIIKQEFQKLCAGTISAQEFVDILEEKSSK